MANFKGFAIRGLLRFLRDRQPGSTPQVIASLPPELRKHFDNPIAASKMYPYEVFSSMLREIDRKFGRGDLGYCIEVGDYSAQQDISGMFKVLMAVLTPDMLLKRSAIFWSKYCDRGDFQHQPLEGNRYAMRLTGFPEIDEAHCFLMIGWMTRFGLASKARTVDMRHTACVHHGGAYCQWEGSWTKV